MISRLICALILHRTLVGTGCCLGWDCWYERGVLFSVTSSRLGRSQCFTQQPDEILAWT